jgi:protein-S-isoprenylcysteine O-methyltransferase Ste14
MILRAMARLLIGLLLFIGLPLLGWGIYNLDEFFANPARLGYVALSVLAQVVILLVLSNAGKGSGSGKALLRRQRLALIILQVLSLALVVSAPYCDRRSIATLGGSEVARYIGLSLYLIGMFVMHWAEANLGRQFSIDVTIQEGHRLITNGLYRNLRHPRYLGIMLFSIGISLVFRSLLGLAIVALLVVVLAWRIHDEEILMHKQFGIEWENYSRRSRRLIPFVY